MTRRILMLLASTILLSAGARADGPLTVTLGTATPGGGFAIYGDAVAEAIGKADPDLKIELRATGGSGENLPMLQAGKLDLALVEGTIAHEVLARAEKGQAALPVIAAMYPTPGMFVVRADSPYRSIADLAGRRVVFGAANSGLVVLARYLLDGLGLDMQRDFDAVLLKSAKEGPPQVLEGKAAALWGGGLGCPGFEAVAKGPQGARFIVPDAEGLARIRNRHPFLQGLAVPAESYPGQNEELVTLGTWSLILARPDLPDAVAVRFTRALFADAGTPRPQALKQTTVANTRTAVPVERMHAGVRTLMGQ